MPCGGPPAPINEDSHAVNAPAAANGEDNVVTEKDEKFDKLIEVASTKKEWYGVKHAARFILEDGSLLPSMDGEHELSVRIQGSLLDPRLQLFVSDIEYPMSLEFRAAHMDRLRSQTETSGQMIILEIRLDFEGYISIGLTTRRPDEIIDKIRGHMITTLSTAQLQLKVFFDDQEKAQDFLSELQRHFQSKGSNFGMKGPRAKCVKTPWYPYCGIRSMDPQVQYGQLVTRKELKQRIEGNQIMRIPASNHFYDLREASIKLVYGAVLEHRISTMHLQRLSGMEHSIFIFSVPGSQVLLGAIKLQALRDSHIPSSITEMAPIVPDGTTCVVSVHNKATSRWHYYEGVATPEVFKLPVTNNLVLLLMPSGRPSSDLNNVLSARHEPTKEFTCKIKFQTHTNNVKAQVNAITTVCSTSFDRWYQVLLNQDYAAIGVRDVFKDLPEDQIARAYDQVHAMKDWNPSQLQAFKLLRDVPGDGFAFIEGIFGCGKTLVQVMLAKILVSLGKHVMIVAPTNAALRAISDSMVKNVGDVEAVRVVYAGSDKIMQFGLDDDERGRAETEELSMFRLVKDLTTLHASRYEVSPEHDLQGHVQKLVAALSERGETIQFEYLPDHYDAVEVYNRFKSTDFTENPPKLGNERNEWEKNKGLFAKALTMLQEKVIANTKVLLCTQQLASSTLIRQNFAAVKSKGIVIIADEDRQSLEPVAWIPVALLRQKAKIQAVLRFGDCQQLPPMAVSATSNLSEFGGQINRSLFDRHLSYHEPGVSLNMQYRMHPLLAQYPNNFTYKGKLLNAPGTENIVVDEIFHERLVDWAKRYYATTYKPDANFSRLLGVKVEGAKVKIDPVTHSHKNERSAMVMAELLDTIFSKAPYPKTSMTIITPYNAQRALYLEYLNVLKQRTGLPLAELPRIKTIDSMQGHESDIVLLDWVNLYGDRLGFLDDNRRINVALSRARASLITFFSYGTSNEIYKPRKRKHKGSLPPMEVTNHWDWLVQRGFDIKVPAKEDGWAGINK
ncbi:hypothetical protein TCE0_015f02759 [Talaromyces pinophilus]|uniref:Uncharacterized protein n=1 Tax=Talaromyces pinophilus TaxID=128442 RepID=A0A6V8H0P2_TALPI|nr:hypothetical protein TCE0_015f02759 [Talaromyces pinophilus]